MTETSSHKTKEMPYDAVIVGGGPAGLAAALTLGRARKCVLLCDAGPRRNAAALHVHNFVTRDGITPQEFRRIGRQQLEPYANVEVRDERVEEIRGESGAFEVRLATGIVEARRVVLCTGMIDELPNLEGFRELWGTSIFQCPYCHGWEVQDRRFGYLAASVEALDFSLLLRGWTGDVTLLTNGLFPVEGERAERFAAAGVRLEERRLARLVPGDGPALERIEFEEGPPLALDALFVHPRQRQIDLVAALGLQLTPAGFVQVDVTTRETSMPGLYAAGDLATMQGQGALLSAAAGTLAAATLNHSLTIELATRGALP
jgi:thioredoxin reductase